MAEDHTDMSVGILILETGLQTKDLAKLCTHITMEESSKEHSRMMSEKVLDHSNGPQEPSSMESGDLEADSDQVVSLPKTASSTISIGTSHHIVTIRWRSPPNSHTERDA